MCKGKSFFWEGIIYQILWIIASTILFFIIYKTLDNFFADSINKGLPLDKFSSFYFEIGKYIILLLEIIFILLGTFIIQRKRFYAYNQYFESGLNYLKSEDKDLIAFHESLSKERDIFIELHNYHKELEKKYDLVYKEKTDLLTYLAHDIKTPLANMFSNVREEFIRLREMDATERMNNLYNTIERPNGDLMEHQRKMLNVLYRIFAQNFRCVASYKPKACKSKLRVFECESPIANFFPSLFSEGKNTWEKYAENEFYFDTIAGDHISCMNSPYIESNISKILNL